MQWHRLPRVVVWSLSQEVIKNHRDVVLRDMVNGCSGMACRSQRSYPTFWPAVSPISHWTMLLDPTSQTLCEQTTQRRSEEREAGSTVALHQPSAPMGSRPSMQCLEIAQHSALRHKESRAPWELAVQRKFTKTAKSPRNTRFE